MISCELFHGLKLCDYCGEGLSHGRDRRCEVELAVNFLGGFEDGNELVNVPYALSCLTLEALNTLQRDQCRRPLLTYR